MREPLVTLFIRLVLQTTDFSFGRRWGEGVPKKNPYLEVWGHFSRLEIVQKPLFNNLYYVNHNRKVQFQDLLKPFFQSGFFEVRPQKEKPLSFFSLTTLFFCLGSLPFFSLFSLVLCFSLCFSFAFFILFPLWYSLVLWSFGIL